MGRKTERDRVDHSRDDMPIGWRTTGKGGGRERNIDDRQSMVPLCMEDLLLERVYDKSMDERRSVMKIVMSGRTWCTSFLSVYQIVTSVWQNTTGIRNPSEQEGLYSCLCTIP